MNITPLENWIASKIGGHPEPAVLQAYQLWKLRETIEYARARSRFYKEHLSGLDPIASLGDLARLPFTYPGDIARAPNDFLCVSPREIDRIVTLSTSGTTGNPKRVFFTEDDQALTVDFFHHGMTTLTDSTDRVMIFMPGTTPGSVGDLLVKALARFGCTGLIYGPIKDYAHAALALQDENITAVVGIPSQILTLARTTTAGAIARVKSILLSADYVPAAAVAAIQKAWGAVVYGHYGMTETGLGGGVECEARCGYHLREADLYYEVIDPTTGLPVPDGEYGEVVFTTLTRRGMPLIRYRTGDWARFLLEPCPCGSVLRRLGKVAGRIAEPVRLNSNQTLYVTQLDEIVLADDNVLSYEAALETRDGQDCLVLTVRSDGCADLGRLSHNLQTALPLFASGGLMLDVREGDPDFFTTGTLKRRIEDHRKTENCHI